MKSTNLQKTVSLAATFFYLISLGPYSYAEPVQDFEFINGQPAATQPFIPEETSGQTTVPLEDPEDTSTLGFLQKSLSLSFPLFSKKDNEDFLDSITVTINNGATHTNDPNVTVNLSAGMAMPEGETFQMAFSQDGVNFSGYEDFAETKSLTLEGEDGEKTIYIKTSDGATLKNFNVSIILDRKPPGPADDQAVLVIDQGAEYVSATLVDYSLAIQDEYSKQTELQVLVTVDGYTVSPGYKTFQAKDDVVLPNQNLEHNICAKFRDAAGNESGFFCDSVKLDQTLPTGSIVIDNGAAISEIPSIQVSLNATDTLSGVEQVRFHINQAGALRVIDWQPYAAEKVIALDAIAGLVTVDALIKDRAGNIKILSDSIKIQPATTTGPLSYISAGLYELTLDQAFKDYLARIMPADKLAGLSADEKVLIEINAAQDYVKKYLADVYDFLVFLPSEKAIKDNLPFYKANYLGQVLGLGGAVVNDTEGIGMQLLTAEQLARLDPFEKLINQEFGSFFCGLFENGTQQGAAMVDVISTLREYPNNNKFVDYVLLHELAHRWGVYLTSNGSQTSNPLGILGRDNAHWSMFFDGGLSPMDAFNWVDNGNGTFTLTHIQGMKVDDIVDYAYGWRSDIPVSYAFNDFDLYAMGVLDKSNVASSFVIDNPRMKDGRALTETNFLNVAFSDANFLSTFTIKGTKRQVTIQDVVQIEGERDPAFSSSQKNFSVALIYMKDDSDASTGNSAKSAQTRWKDTIDDIWATATRSLSAMSLGFTSAAFNVFKENVLGLFDESIDGEGQDAGEETKAQDNLSTLDALDALIQSNETLLAPLLERAQTNPLLDAYLGDLPEDLAEIKQAAIDYRKAIQDALALVGDSSAFIAGKRSEIETKVLQAAITGLLPAGFGSSAEAIIQEVLNLFTGVKAANDSFTAGSASFQLSLDTYKIKLEGLSQPFEGTMTLAGDAAYTDTAAVALELHHLPVSGSSLDPVADRAYALDQSLGLYFTGKDYYNCAKLQEKWFRAANVTGDGNGWYYIAPGGVLYRWLGGARDHNEYVTTLSDAYYQTPVLLYEAKRPAGVGTGIVTATYTVNGAAQGNVPGFSPGDADQTVSLTLPSGDGPKEVTVTLTNGIGDEFALTKTVTLDETKSAADFTINGGVAVTEVLDVELDLSKLSDATSGIAQVRVSMDGGTTWAVVDLATLTDGKYKGTLPDGKGKKTINVEVTDKAGNKDVGEQTIKYQPPTGPFLGTMTLAGDAEYTGSATVSLELNKLGDDMVSASYAVNGVDQGNIPGFAAGVAGQTLSLTLPAGDGLKEVAVTLTNDSGDEYVLTKTISLDLTKPAIVFTINGGALQTDVLDVELDLSKLSDATSGIAQVRVSMDGGASWTVVDLSTLTGGKYNGTLPDGKGTKTVKVEVTDKAGNKDVGEQTIKYQPPPGPFSGTMTLAGDAEYTATTVVTIELNNLPVSEGGADPVAEEAYELDQSLGFYFTGKDYYNCAKLQEKWFRAANVTGAGNGWYYIAPGGVLYRWLGGARTNNQYVTTLSDAYYQTPGLLYDADKPIGSGGEGIVTATYAVNGVAQGNLPGFKIGEADQTLPVTMPSPDGAKEVAVTLTDGDGNEYVLTKTITLDETKPAADFTINGGAAQTDVLDVELDLSKVSDATSGIAQVRVSMDGGTSWTVVDLSTLTDGKYKGTLSDGKGKKTIKVEVTDKVGNKNTAEQTIKYQPPTGPFLGTMTLAGDAEYTGTAAVSLELNKLGDAMISASYAVNGAEQGNIPGFKTGEAGQTLSLTLPAGDGLKEVAVTLTDGNGDEYILTKSITLDETKPAADFTIDGGAAQTDVLDVELDLSKLSDETSGIAQVRVSMDGGTSWTVVDLATLTDGKYKGTLPDGKGTKTVKVEVTDKVGHKNTVEQTIKYVPPGGTFPGTMTLEGDAEYTATTAVALELNDLPVSEGGADPVAEEAYELDQSLGFYFTGKDYYNCAKLQEKWFRAANVTGAGNGWYYIAPGGVLYRWLGGARTNNQYVTTLSDAYYQTPGLLYDAEKPVGSGGEGIVTATYTVNGAAQGNVPGFKTGEADQTLSLTLPAGDGLKEVEVTLTDGDGNEYVLTNTITLDQTKPAADFTVNGGAAETDVLDVELDLSKLSDATSGIAQVRVSMDGGTSWVVVDLSTLTGGKYNGTVPDGNGTKTVKVEVTDKAGNQNIAEQAIKYVPPGGTFPGTMTLAGGAEDTDTAVVTLELNHLPVSEGEYDPVAEEAYELDQSLGLYFTGKDYYNCAKLKEKWIRSTVTEGPGNGWYYIAPGGVLYKWLGGKRDNNEYVTTLSDAYYQTPGLLYDAGEPVGTGEGIATASYAVNGVDQGSVPGFKTGAADQILSLTLPAGAGLKVVEVTLVDGLGNEFVLTKSITLH